jgi:putative hydrolase of the HAD superfamily
MPSIAAVLFDADGVMQRPADVRHALWVQLLGGDATSVDGFLRDMSAIERPAYHGEGDFVGAIPEVLARWRCTGTVDDALRAWTAIEADPGILAIIAAIRASGIACCLATNQEPYRGRYMSETMEYRRVFDAQFYSCELGLSKPDPAYFTTILETLQLAPERILFIDDNEPNVRAAQSVGLWAEVFAPEAGTAPVDAMRALLGRHLVPMTPA